jgi:hypothetical protein
MADRAARTRAIKDAARRVRAGWPRRADETSLVRPWPFGGRSHDGGLPEPAPEIVMEATGIYWRRYPGSLSMVPTSDSNDPILSPLAVYRLVGWEDHDGTLRSSTPLSRNEKPDA